MVESRRKILFPDVTDEQWNDWHWQVKNRIETLEDLKKYVDLTPEEEEGVKACLGTLRMAITPYYLSLIQPGDPHDPVRLQAVPTAKELHQSASDLLDPLHEDEDSPAPGLTHRYPDRCLLLITDQCSMYCRHCTRRRFAGQNDAGLPVDQVTPPSSVTCCSPAATLCSAPTSAWSTSSPSCVRSPTWRSSASAPVPPWCCLSVSLPSCAIC